MMNEILRVFAAMLASAGAVGLALFATELLLDFCANAADNVVQ